MSLPRGSRRGPDNVVDRGLREALFERPRSPRVLVDRAVRVEGRRTLGEEKGCDRYKRKPHSRGRRAATPVFAPAHRAASPIRHFEALETESRRRSTETNEAPLAESGFAAHMDPEPSPGTSYSVRTT